MSELRGEMITTPFPGFWPSLDGRRRRLVRSKLVPTIWRICLRTELEIHSPSDSESHFPASAHPAKMGKIGYTLYKSPRDISNLGSSRSTRQVDMGSQKEAGHRGAPGTAKHDQGRWAGNCLGASKETRSSTTN